jgi:hypothetical protein
MHTARLLLGLAVTGLVLVTPAAGQAPAPREGKPGGVLRLVLREDLPQGFALHETATNVTYNRACHRETWLDR